MEEKDTVTEEFFRDRLRFLRNERGVSAREMSLDLEQNETYINKIETGKSSTTIASFLKMCDYFGITPADFFERDAQNAMTNDAELLGYLHRLTPRQSEYMVSFLRDLTER